MGPNINIKMNLEPSRICYARDKQEYYMSLDNKFMCIK